MNIIPAAIPEILIIEPKVFEDERGYFFESFHEEQYSKTIGGLKFVQDNVSCSSKNTVRGLHFQTGLFAQGKLCQILWGNVLDVAVDIRIGSPSYGKYIVVELSASNKKQLWIPPGFAHGFSVLSEMAIFLYKCNQYYNKASERTVIFNDPDLRIDWKIEHPIVSVKDLQGIFFRNLHSDFVYP